MVSERKMISNLCLVIKKSIKGIFVKSWVARLFVPLTKFKSKIFITLEKVIINKKSDIALLFSRNAETILKNRSFLKMYTTEHADKK